jgi:septal ring factor EnvC (AmiA/AmiB activator)
MNTIALEDSVLRKSSGVALAQQNFIQSAISIGRLNDAETALALVAEAGQAVRKIETESRDAITRATNAALAVKERLVQTVARAEQAEAALRKAGSEIDELSRLAEQAGDEIAKLRALLASTEKRLAETTKRAEAAEQTVEAANNSIQRIVNAIRTELPIV